MNKKFWVGFIVLFVLMSIMSFIIHAVLLSSTYMAPDVMKLMRPEAEMMGMMWIYYVVYLIVAFVLTWIFSKGYEGKGIAEGVRYGFFTGLLMATPMAYASYAMYPIPYSLALQWFLYGMIEYIILGVALALVFGKNATVTKVAAS